MNRRKTVSYNCGVFFLRKTDNSKNKKHDNDAERTQNARETACKTVILLSLGLVGYKRVRHMLVHIFIISEDIYITFRVKVPSSKYIYVQVSYDIML